MDSSVVLEVVFGLALVSGIVFLLRKIVKFASTGAEVTKKYQGILVLAEACLHYAREFLREIKEVEGGTDLATARKEVSALKEMAEAFKKLKIDTRNIVTLIAAMEVITVHITALNKAELLLDSDTAGRIFASFAKENKKIEPITEYFFRLVGKFNAISGSFPVSWMGAPQLFVPDGKTEVSFA